MTDPLTQAQVGCPSCRAVAATWITDCMNPIHMAQANAYIHFLEHERGTLTARVAALVEALRESVRWHEHDNMQEAKHETFTEMLESCQHALVPTPPQETP